MVSDAVECADTFIWNGVCGAVVSQEEKGAGVRHAVSARDAAVADVGDDHPLSSDDLICPCKRGGRGTIKNQGGSMFKHEKKLFHPVAVERPNPQYAALLQEQLGGGNGELKAALQYMSQSFRIRDPEIHDLFLDIAAEELSHMEMIGKTITLLNGHDVDAESVPCGEIQTHVLLGLNPGLVNASGYSWTGDYVTVTGDLCADLLSNIASEQRAKVVYEYLYRQICDKKVRETIDFLLNREEAHNTLFREAFEKVQNSGSNRDFGTTKAATMYANLSSPSPADHFNAPKNHPTRFGE